MQFNRIEKSEELASAIELFLDSSKEARLHKKLHTVLLVARHPDNNCSEVARQLGYSTHTVARWVRSVCNDDGFTLSELKDKEKPGRKKRLTPKQLSIIYDVLEKHPKGYSKKKWTGKELSEYIFKEFKVELQVRQCQKIIKSRKSNL
ncbi:MAG: helix-turn-helix domain-containing protein [Segetibacter sp.]|nr:helix-turn-helix domain-containing protein [Segetibacter sp.]